RWNSRKYRSAWGLTWLITAVLIVPWLTGLLPFLVAAPLMEANTWAMLIMGIWGAYFAANVTEKHNAFVPDEVRFQENENGAIS
ncbi:MAG: hypothetical protein ACXABY_02945, partial [Candidatus Thorarchaeota archaeon]